MNTSRPFPQRALGRHAGEYPHLSPEDVGVWRQFLPRCGLAFTSLLYDVRVGRGSHRGDPRDPEPDPAFSELLRKRIDVVAHYGDHVVVIEVKPEASMLALGQVLTYRQLLAPTYPYGTKFQAWIVCNHADQDLRPLWPLFDVRICVVAGGDIDGSLTWLPGAPPFALSPDGGSSSTNRAATA